LLGVSLSAHSQVAVADSERFTKQYEALEALESAGRMTKMQDSNILYHLSLENAEQRKLDVALYYAKHLLKLESGSTIRGWLLLARILSAQRLYKDAETVINAALDQTGKWDQGELLRTKAKLQIAQGQLENGIESYIQLLAVLQIQSKSLGPGTKLYKVRELIPANRIIIMTVLINSQIRNVLTCQVIILA
jgi:tetratricopeptide (TPR) repeat protein